MLAIFRDVTEREQQRQELETLRTETLQRTQEVITKQMRVAHEIAGLLGETTAETKVVLTQLTKLLQWEWLGRDLYEHENVYNWT